MLLDKKPVNILFCPDCSGGMKIKGYEREYSLVAVQAIRLNIYRIGFINNCRSILFWNEKDRSDFVKNKF